MPTGREHVTVVIPAWGTYVERFLERALASVAAQQVEGLHILIVDNCHDQPITVSAPHCAVVRTPSRVTVGPARNFGLRSVTTGHVLFLDADDELAPGAITRMQEVLHHYPSVAVVAPQLIDRETGAVYHWPPRWAYRVSNRFPNLFRVLEAVRPLFPVNVALMRTSIAAQSPGYGESSKSAEDWVLGVSLALRGPVRLLNAPGLVYSVRTDGQWAGQTGWRSQLMHRKEIRCRLRNDPHVPATIRMLVPVLAIVHAIDVVRAVYLPRAGH